MAAHKGFDREMMKTSLSMPEESNEIYKHRYVKVADDINRITELDNIATDNEADLLRFHNESFKGSNLQFDAIIGNGCMTVKDEAREFIKWETRTEFSNSRVQGMDKYTVFMGSCPDSVAINVPDGKEANLKILVANIGGPLALTISIRIGKGAKLNLFEWHASAMVKDSFSGVLHQISADPGSDSEISALYNHNDNTIVLNNSIAEVQDSATLSLNYA